MFKNVASQKAIFFAFTITTGAAKTGDAANITPYESLDYGAVTPITDSSMTEMDATNAPGYYICDLTQGETNADTILFSAKSSTANISVIGAPATVFTYPATGILAPTVAGRTLDVSAGGEAGVDWANVGSPTTVVGLSGTTVKTATDVETDTADIQSRLPAALVSGRIDASVGAMAANVLTAAATAADFTTEVTSGLATTAHVQEVEDKVDIVDTVADAIKAKTDSLTFTVAGLVDANIQRINDVAIVGDGSGTPFNV